MFQHVAFGQIQSIVCIVGIVGFSIFDVKTD